MSQTPSKPESKPTDDSLQAPGAQTLRRGLAVLKLLARISPRGLRVSDIGRQLGLNKATAIRLTHALVEEKFLVLDDATRSYRLGPEAFAVGLAAEPSYALQRLSAPHLRVLALETGDWIYFSVPNGHEVICISRETGNIPIPRDALKVGDRHPVGIGAGGVAILAAWPDDEVDAALAANAEVIERDHPRCGVAVIRELVRQTRERGYSEIPGLIVRDYWAIGVALTGADGRPEAAITLVASGQRLPAARRQALGERMARLSRDLMEAAASPARDRTR